MMTTEDLSPLDLVIDNPAALLPEVEAALDTIRPWMITDGGNVRILELTPTGILRLELEGACGSCPMSAMTMKAGVEEAIRRAVPAIIRVEAVNAVVAH
jgi:Fe-S cluster biogenesis protein NfuA